MKTNTPFPNFLREVLFKKNITQVRLAIQTRINPAVISRLAHGYIYASPRQRQLIAEALHLRIRDIFPDADTSIQSPSGIR